MFKTNNYLSLQALETQIDHSTDMSMAVKVLVSNRHTDLGGGGEPADSNPHVLLPKLDPQRHYISKQLKKPEHSPFN